MQLHDHTLQHHTAKEWMKKTTNQINFKYLQRFYIKLMFKSSLQPDMKFFNRFYCSLYILQKQKLSTNDRIPCARATTKYRFLTLFGASICIYIYLYAIYCLAFKLKRIMCISLCRFQCFHYMYVSGKSCKITQ